jgi:hypothetical protein
LPHRLVEFIVNSSLVSYDGDRNVRDEERSVEQEQKTRERSFIGELVPDWRPTKVQALRATRTAMVVAAALLVVLLT